MECMDIKLQKMKKIKSFGKSFEEEQKKGKQKNIVLMNMLEDY